MKAGGLRYVQIANLDVPALRRKFANEKAGKGTFAYATFLRNHCYDESHLPCLPQSMAHGYHDSMSTWSNMEWAVESRSPAKRLRMPNKRRSLHATVLPHRTIRCRTTQPARRVKSCFAGVECATERWGLGICPHHLSSRPSLEPRDAYTQARRRRARVLCPRHLSMKPLRR